MPWQKQSRRSPPPALRLAGMGAELAGAVLGFALVGIWIDRHYGTHPWGVLICAVSGLIGGLYNFFRSSMKTLDASNRRAGGTEDGGEDEGRR